jgi:hypothetical protein
MDWLQIVGPLKPSTTGSYTVQASSWVVRTRWQSLIACDLKLTVYSTGFCTSFHYYLPHLVYNSHSWVDIHLSLVWVDQNRAEWRVLHPLCHLVKHNSNGVRTVSFRMLWMQSPEIWPRTEIEQWYIYLDTARMRCSRPSNVSYSMSR